MIYWLVWRDLSDKTEMVLIPQADDSPLKSHVPQTSRFIENGQSSASHKNPPGFKPKGTPRQSPGWGLRSRTLLRSSELESGRGTTSVFIIILLIINICSRENTEGQVAVHLERQKKRRCEQNYLENKAISNPTSNCIKTAPRDRELCAQRREKKH